MYELPRHKRLRVLEYVAAMLTADRAGSLTWGPATARDLRAELGKFAELVASWMRALLGLRRLGVPR